MQFFTICRNAFSSQDGIFEEKLPLLSEGTHMKIIRRFLFRFSSVLTKDEKWLVHNYPQRLSWGLRWINSEFSIIAPKTATIECNRFHVQFVTAWHLEAYLFPSVIGKLLWSFIDLRNIHQQFIVRLLFHCSMQFSLIGSSLLGFNRITQWLHSHGWLHHASIYHSALRNIIYHRDQVEHMLVCVMKYPGWVWAVAISFFLQLL